MFDIFLLIVGIIFIFVGSYDICIGINWACMFGQHKYVYVGQKHGMVMSLDRKGVIGTQRNMYKCCECKANKPIENSDYVD
jgi:hypothetical protein